MWQTILWKVIWMLVPKVLNVAGDIVTIIMNNVTKANDLKHEDGTVYAGTEKLKWVMVEVEKEVLLVYKPNEIAMRAIRLLIELAVNYQKKV
jgi:hypothetical protein